jgi:2-C-methyl-D-erythritol 4-phosphate cytidylyltransferase/2-C-methyl-D-erythritol 2,4-cyclodiphosphate synthase
LNSAHIWADKKGIEVTDDAELMDYLKVKVKTIPGESNAFKITYPEDLVKAQNILDSNLNPLSIRTGIGTDTHAFSKDPDRKLWLGGVLWENEIGLDGHSDADTAIHAICDAIFSASELGDLGSNFGVDQPEYAGASGEKLLTEALRRAKLAGYLPVNISVQIIGNRPKINLRRNEIVNRISELVGIPAITVTATTTDGLGMTGEGKGISAIAIATMSYQGI